GRARLPRAGAAATAPLLRAPAVAADLQADPDGGGLRPLLPDRDLPPGRGSARRPPVRAPPAGCGDGLPGARGRLGRDGGRGLRIARGAGTRTAAATVPSYDVAGGTRPVRLGQARPPLWPRDRGRDRAHARVELRRLRERALRAFPP